jgi:hypothetical protein
MKPGGFKLMRQLDSTCTAPHLVNVPARRRDVAVQGDEFEKANFEKPSYSFKG